MLNQSMSFANNDPCQLAMVAFRPAIVRLKFCRPRNVLTTALWQPDEAASQTLRHGFDAELLSELLVMRTPLIDLHLLQSVSKRHRYHD